MINIPKGTKDVLPEDSRKWQFLEETARTVCALYGAKEIRTPVFEYTELFLRGVGETTDVVNKEMYTFNDKGGRSITLKPEGTAGVARSFVENGLFNGRMPLKLFYFSPVFRYERPQAGRLREHHQFGVEYFGAAGAEADAEVIALAHNFLTRVGVERLRLEINSIGCPNCRAAYNAALKKYYSTRIDEACPTCRERLGKNALRLLDCKNAGCKQIAASAPIILDYICGDCSGHLSLLQDSLDSIGIAYTINPTIVRGLDYYTKTVFEFVTDAVGAQGTVCGGGRYDGLIESIGGKFAPAVGFGMGLERLLLLLEACGKEVGTISFPDVYIVAIGDAAKSYAFGLAHSLRQQGYVTETDLSGRSVKAQFKQADASGARFCLIIGDDELRDGQPVLKDLSNGQEKKGVLSELLNLI